MTRTLAPLMLVALLALASVIPSASVAQDARAPLAVVTDLPPVPVEEFAPAPQPAPVAPAVEEEATDVAAWIAGAIGRALADGLYWVLGVAGAWLMGMMGFKEWNAAKVQEALRDEKMKPYAEGVVRFVVDWLTRTLKRQPKVTEVLDWITEQFPEVRNWIGRTTAERTKYLETFLDTAPLALASGSTSSGTASARPTKRRPTPPRSAAKVDQPKPTVGAGTTGQP